MDGFEVAERLRSLPDFERILIVGSSGYSRESDRRRAAEVGIDLYLVKPFDPWQLESILDAHRTTRRGHPRLILASPARGDSADPSSRRRSGARTPSLGPLVEQLLQDPRIDRLDQVEVESGVHGAPAIGLEPVAADADQQAAGRPAALAGSAGPPRIRRSSAARCPAG